MNNVARHNSELPRIRFLDYELDLSQTFLDIAAGESDHPCAVLAARRTAQLGHDVVLTWIDSIRSTRERDRLMNRLFDLRKRLDDLDAVGSRTT